jgi:hypothetical protein
MDDLDNFFGQDACNAFVAGMQFDYMHTEEAEENKKEFAQALIENDDLLLSSLYGQNYESDIKAGKFNKMSLDGMSSQLFGCELCGMFYPKDRKVIEDLIKDMKGD